MNHQQEIHQFNESHFREFDVSQHIVMMVVGNNIVCIGLYGAVNELIVIRVGSDEVETICGINQFNMPTLHQGVNDSFCKSWAKESFQNFLVFRNSHHGAAGQTVELSHGNVKLHIAAAVWTSAVLRKVMHDLLPVYCT